MYVPKTTYFSSVPSSSKAFDIFVMCERSKYVLRVEVSSFPCGRIRLIARNAGFILTGNENNCLKDVTFDSVRSLYACPGCTVLTSPDVVYAFCGRKPRLIGD